MRLIDADNLKPDAQWEFFYNCYFAYSISQIDDAPTVKAVPIEVLQEIADEIAEQSVDLRDGSEWHNYVNETVIDCLEIIDKHIKQIEGRDKE